MMVRDVEILFWLCLVFAEIENTVISGKWARKKITEEDRKEVVGLRRDEKGWNSHLENEKVNGKKKIRVTKQLLILMVFDLMLWDSLSIQSENNPVSFFLYHSMFFICFLLIVLILARTFKTQSSVESCLKYLILLLYLHLNYHHLRTH